MCASRLIALALAGLLALAGCAAPAQETADITLTSAGCAATRFALPNTREPQITISNQSDLPMVFSIPTMNRWVAVAPGDESAFALPRYIMGSFDFFCLSEAEHTQLGGGNPLLCALEPRELAAVARSQGVFEIERHDRIREVLQAQP
ncbi:cupredoxin domain-containing protein [Oscillochloris sp. ZM17-4]|uniref:cupredoxin domain-containing protein n=1 Tax=Oscillochloris sp. ZM17-4 TaxID=2866714 RepID=UPI001C734192|nr:cupredoxin domain-containing protein [Oscillochloris sp. ZM17-4]MBX0329200.1 cupredoxin domain-containing protein [Oscillochloris sp. ZM17-4]